jgi:hypothetical protein
MGGGASLHIFRPENTGSTGYATFSDASYGALNLCRTDVLDNAGGLVTRRSVKRLDVRWLVGALVMLLVLPSALSYARQADNGASPGLTFEGDTALWTMAIKPEKTADFEKVMTRLRDALTQSNDPRRKQQAAGWRVMKISKPLADGNTAYVHIIHPVVSGADYTIMKTLYDAFPDERQALYESYRGAFDKNLSLATGSIVMDMSKP